MIYAPSTVPSVSVSNRIDQVIGKMNVLSSKIQYFSVEIKKDDNIDDIV